MHCDFQKGLEFISLQQVNGYAFRWSSDLPRHFATTLETWAQFGEWY